MSLVERVSEGVRNSIEVVQESVNEVRDNVARFVGGGERTQANPTEADAALHRVAQQVSTANALTPDDERRIDAGIDQVFERAGNSGEGGATVELANQLRGQSADYQSEFMARLYEINPYVATDILRTAGGQMPHYISDARPTEDDSRVIGSALGAAYDQKKLPSNFVDQLLTMEQNRLPPRNEYTGNMVALSGSKDLMTAFADKSLELWRNGDDSTSSFVLGAARALSGDAELLQSRLQQMTAAQRKLDATGQLDAGEMTLSQFVEAIDPKKFEMSVPYYEADDNALMEVLDTATRIQPPTDEVLDLFTTVASKYMDRPGVDAMMGKLFTSGYTEYLRYPNGKIDDTIFHSNADFFMHRMMMAGIDPQTGRGVDEATQINAMANFFQHTVFDDDSAYREPVRMRAAEMIESLQSAIKNYPNVDARTRSLIDSTIKPEPGKDPVASVREQLANRLGRFTGAIFEGFEKAVTDRNAENAQIDSAVDFLFDIVPFDKGVGVLKSRVPGAGTLIGLGADKGLDKAKGMLKEWFHERDLEKDRQQVWDLFMEFANNVEGYYSDEFYNGALTAEYVVRNSGR